MRSPSPVSAAPQMLLVSVPSSSSHCHCLFLLSPGCCNSFSPISLLPACVLLCPLATGVTILHCKFVHPTVDFRAFNGPTRYRLQSHLPCTQELLPLSTSSFPLSTLFTLRQPYSLSPIHSPIHPIYSPQASSLSGN